MVEGDGPMLAAKAAKTGGCKCPKLTCAWFLTIELASIVIGGPLSPKVQADPLTGDAGVVDATPYAAAINPANAGFLDRTQLSYSPALFTSDSYLIRYPGFETTSHGQSGLQLPLAIPNFVWKVNSRLGVGGIAAPPGLSLPINATRIPVVVLNTQSYVDIKGAAKINGYVSGLAGLRIGRWGGGVSANYGSVDVDVKVTPTEGGDPLVTVVGSASVANLAAGVRYELVRNRLSIGAAFGLISMQNFALEYDSPLLDETSGGGDGVSKVQVANPFDSILLGTQALVTPGFRLLLDLKWKRAAKNQEQFSLVELRQKQRDVYDVLAVRAGAVLRIMDGADALLGGQYHPSAIGPGRLSNDNDEGLAGFGTMDVVQTFLPLIGQDLQPYWLISAGLQIGFSPQIERVALRGKRSSTRRYDAWTIATGLVYKRASLGIDENGEQPGAYLRTTATIPLQITYKF